MGFINKGEDNFFHHGLMIGLALFPLATMGCVSWIALFVRSVILSLSMGLWCKWFKNDWVEELGRGGIIILTLPILLI